MATVSKNRSAYSKSKRLRRGILKTLGRWSRKNYDVRLIHENDKPVCKQVIFKTAHEARRVSDNLRRYGSTPHLPTLLDRRDNAVWVDFVHGRPCHSIDDSMVPQLAQCFGEFARRDSRLVRLDATPYWRSHLDNLDCLRQRSVICDPLHRELSARSKALAPTHIRLGFDYIDPIGANLVQREDSGRICAIDIKNLHADTLIGEGLAKAADRWLSLDRRAFFFAHLQQLGLEDLPRAFPFLLLFEGVRRVMRKTNKEIKIHNRVRAARSKADKLAGLLA